MNYKIMNYKIKAAEFEKNTNHRIKYWLDLSSATLDLDYCDKKLFKNPDQIFQRLDVFIIIIK